MAARLAEGRSNSVLLLEAGPDSRANPPAGIRDGWGISREEIDWGYRSEPNAQGVVRNVWRSKLVGGTSWLTRFALRGSPADFNAWAARGNPGWAFEDVLPYFNRMEKDLEFGQSSWHGYDGPMPVTRYPEVEYSDVCAAAMAATEDAGFPAVEDHNQPGAVGLGRMPMSSRDGVRVTSADAYLPVGLEPPNLSIRGDAEVAEILFDGRRARGVRLVDGSIIEAGWVVLCAGVYGSPAILMRSGVGPADHLRSVGIAVTADLPGVGANLADHPSIAIDCGYSGPARRGPLLHAAATFHSSATPIEAAPDLMFWLSDPEGDPPGFEIGVLLLKPLSRGVVRLRSADPREAPSITLPSRDDPNDAVRLAEGYLRALEVALDPRVRALCTGGPPPNRPVAMALLEKIRLETTSIPHVVGTCAMGPPSDGGAVVDALGRVHGIEALTVADASIMPDEPSGFTHFPTIMVAERLSDFVVSLL
jgi:choline dehydrogenase